MSGDLKELYQQMIMDHNRNPRNFHSMPAPAKEVEGYNPLCGDHYKIYVKLAGNKIEDISFEGQGCAISKSSASMMTTAIKGKTVEEAKLLFSEVIKMLSRQLGDKFDEEKVGKLATLAGVCEFPSRVKCASLPWHTMIEALNPTGKQITTE